MSLLVSVDQNSSVMTEDVRLIAGAKVRCPDCETGVKRDGSGRPCMTCAGTPGLVYLLDKSVRVLCPGHDEYSHEERARHGEDCQQCRQHPAKLGGWTAALDSWVWWRALDKAGFHISLYKMEKSKPGRNWCCYIWPPPQKNAEQVHSYGDDPELLFFVTLLEAIKLLPGVVL